MIQLLGALFRFFVSSWNFFTGCLLQICIRFFRVVLFLVIFAVIMFLYLSKYVYLSLYIFYKFSLPGNNTLETTFNRCRLQQMARLLGALFRFLAHSAFFVRCLLKISIEFLKVGPSFVFITVSMATCPPLSLLSPLYMRLFPFPTRFSLRRTVNFSFLFS